MDVLVPEYIQLPNRRECERQVRLFHEFSPNFHPDVVGVFDGTYVETWCSEEDDKYYRLTNIYFSVNNLSGYFVPKSIFRVFFNFPNFAMFE